MRHGSSSHNPHLDSTNSVSISDIWQASFNHTHINTCINSVHFVHHINNRRVIMYTIHNTLCMLVLTYLISKWCKLSCSSYDPCTSLVSVTSTCTAFWATSFPHPVYSWVGHLGSSTPAELPGTNHQPLWSATEWFIIVGCVSYQML